MVYFNSTMVRLKVFAVSITTVYAKFQFHNGSIKRRPANHYGCRSILDFNSTMVRLKEARFALLHFPFAHFNSTMVRLKETLFPFTE